MGEATHRRGFSARGLTTPLQKNGCVRVRQLWLRKSFFCSWDSFLVLVRTGPCFLVPAPGAELDIFPTDSDHIFKQPW